MTLRKRAAPLGAPPVPPAALEPTKRPPPKDVWERHYTPLPIAASLMAALGRFPHPALQRVAEHGARLVCGKEPARSLLVLEPYAGPAPFLRAAQNLWGHTVDVDGWDIDPNAAAVSAGYVRGASDDEVHADLSQLLVRRRTRLGARLAAPPPAQVLIITNPPWSAIDQRLRRLRLLQSFFQGHGVPAALCVLTRLTILEGAARYQTIWGLDAPDHFAVLTRRVKWEGPATDAAGYESPDKAGTVLCCWGEAPPELRQMRLRPPPTVSWIDNPPRPRPVKGDAARRRAAAAAAGATSCAIAGDDTGSTATGGTAARRKR